MNRLRGIVLLTACAVFSFHTGLYASSKESKPKNIILFISDGCGFRHIEATDDWESGMAGTAVYESFPVKLAVSTLTRDGAITDSAAAATAMSTGAKTCDGMIGMDCQKKPLTHFIERAEQAGKATGVVTTVEISHATPAGFVAHNKSREHYEEIADEMIYKSGLEVLMGAGHPLYTNDSARKAVPEFKYVGGKKTWQDIADGKEWKVIQTRDEFKKLAEGKDLPGRVLGIAQVNGTLQQKRSGDAGAPAGAVYLNEKVPDLAMMTRGALNVLGRDPDGFFLMVEGGAVDWASQENETGRMIEEQADFNRAVRQAVDWVEKNSSWDETLVIVTADHETGDIRGVRDNGRGRTPIVEWHGRNHTGCPVPFYAKGAGSGLFEKAAAGDDPEHGPFIENSDIGKVLAASLTE